MASEFLKADIEELKALRAKSTRVRSQTALDAALASASAALADLPPEVSSEATPEASAAAEVAEVNKGANPNRNEGQASKAKPPPPTLTPGAFVSIGTFGFDPGAYDSPWVKKQPTIEKEFYFILPFHRRGAQSLIHVLSILFKYQSNHAPTYSF
jgi:hypothetical protein